MARVGVAVLVVGAAVWALAFLDFGRARRASAPESAEPASRAEAPDGDTGAHALAMARTPEAAPAAKPAPSTSPSAGPVRATPAASSVGRALSAAASVGSKTADPPGTASVEPEGALSTATGELGEGVLSPEYAELERAYSHEPRDGAWAQAEEARIRELVAGSAVEKSVMLVNCQQTICRMLLESDDYDVFKRLIAVPGFGAFSGLGRESPYSHRAGQLSVFFPRRTALLEPR